MLLRFLRISLHNSCFPVRGNHFLFNYVMIFTLKRGLWRLTGPMMKFSQLSIHDGDQVLRSYAHCITSNQMQFVLSCFRMKVKSENFLQFLKLENSARVEGEGYICRQEKKRYMKKEALFITLCMLDDN